MSKSNKKSEQKQEVNKDLFSLDSVILPADKLLIVNDWNKQTKKPNPVLTLKDTSILLSGSWSLIKAVAKAGKTSICECIIASYLNPKSDNCLGFKLSLYGSNKILFIDTEQSEYESQKSYNRIAQRAGFDLTLPDKPQELNRLIHYNIKRFDIDSMYKVLEKTLTDNRDIGLMIIDVATDLAPNGITDMKESNGLKDWLRKIREDVAIILTVHINENVKNTQNETARGHIGKEFERKCTSVVMLKAKDENTYEMTVSNNRIDRKPDVVYYSYNKNMDMFTETNYVPQLIDKKQKYIDEVNQLFNGEELRTTEYLLKTFQSIHNGTTRKNLEARISIFKSFDLVKNIKKGQWRSKVIPN